MKSSNFKLQISYGLLIIAGCLLSTVLYSCRPALLTPKGAVINRANPNFLKEAGVDEKTDPHKGQKCQVCHTAPDALLIKENPSNDESVQRKLMRTDLINLCYQCHKASAENEHKVGIKTKLNRQNLPLDHEGKIACAVTCHDMHTTAKKPDLKRFFLRQDTNSLCFSCHAL